MLNIYWNFLDNDLFDNVKNHSKWWLWKCSKQYIIIIILDIKIYWVYDVLLVVVIVKNLKCCYHVYFCILRSDNLYTLKDSNQFCFAYSYCLRFFLSAHICDSSFRVYHYQMIWIFSIKISILFFSIINCSMVCNNYNNLQYLLAVDN